MSSIVRKSSSRFAPKLTERKQSRVNNKVEASPTPPKVVRIQEPESSVTETPESDVLVELGDDASRPHLKEFIFERSNDEGAILDDDEDNDEDEDDVDPQKKSSTVIIDPTRLSTQKTRRSSSIISGVASYRRGSVNDENRRMRRLSSITTGLGAGLNVLRRSSAVSTSNHGTPSTVPRRISVSETAEPYKINIPTGIPTKRRKPSAKSFGKLPIKKRQTKPLGDTLEVGVSVIETPLPETLEKESGIVDEEEVPLDQEILEEPAVEEVDNIEQKRLEPKRSRASRISLLSRRDQAQKVKDTETEPDEVQTLRLSTTKKSKLKSKTPLERKEKISIDLDTKTVQLFVDREGELQTVPIDQYQEQDTHTMIKDLSKIPKNLLTNDNKLFNKFSIDEQSITMEDLCRPVLPFGEVSENFDLSIVAARRKRALLVERRKLRVEARDKGITYHELLKQKEEEEILSGKPATVNGVPDSFSNPSVQLKLSESGSFDIAEESLFVDRHNTRGVDNREKISENMFETAAISSTYGKRQVTDKWTTEETKTLYKALSSWGTDFNIITQLFPHRTRHQIKLKFNLEERKRPYIVELALKRKLPIDFDDYCEKTKQNFKTLEEYNQELKELKDKHEREVKEMVEALEKQRKIDLELQVKRQVELRTGVRSMTRAERKAELRKNEVVIGEVKKQEE